MSEWVRSRRGVSIPTGLCSHIHSHNPGSAVKDMDRINLTKKISEVFGDIIKCSGGRGGWTRRVSREKRNMNSKMGKTLSSSTDLFEEKNH